VVQWYNLKIYWISSVISCTTKVVQSGTKWYKTTFVRISSVFSCTTLVLTLFTDADAKALKLGFIRYFLNYIKICVNKKLYHFLQK